MPGGNKGNATVEFDIIKHKALTTTRRGKKAMLLHRLTLAAVLILLIPTDPANEDMAHDQSTNFKISK